MNSTLVERLRVDLKDASYGVGAVHTLLGADADSARQRGVFAAAHRVLNASGDSALPMLVRVFMLGEAVERQSIELALPTLGSQGALALGLIETVEGGKVRASLSLNPVQLNDSPLADEREWWILSDLDDQLRRGPASPDHVMGVGSATRTLIAQLPPLQVERSLDLGTGCGIVALHLALRGRVVATDISERALEFAAANAHLNGLQEAIEFRHGDLFQPVAGERFDLIASNPPFVVTPRGNDAVPRYEYRDGGLIGDELAHRVVREAPIHLADGGSLLCLANWESPWGENGLTRVQRWIEAAAADCGPIGAWVIERDRVSPAQYAETWVRDGGARPGESQFDQLMQAWLNDFSERRITAIGLGSIRIKRLSAEIASRSVLHLEQVTAGFAFERIGEHLVAAFDYGIEAELMSDQEVLRRHWLREERVVEMREHKPGQEAPRSITLRTDRPIERVVAADPLLAAAVGACDGDLTLRQIGEALATLLELDPEACFAALIEGVRELTWLGMLVPAKD